MEQFEVSLAGAASSAVHTLTERFGDWSSTRPTRLQSVGLSILLKLFEMFHV